MTLSEANVKRTWWIDGGGNMVYNLDVSFGQGIANVQARHVVERSNAAFSSYQPSGLEIAHRLESAVIERIRNSLFPKTKD